MKLQGFFLDENFLIFLIYLSVFCIHSWLLVLVNIGSRAAFPAETLLACLSDHRNQLKIVKFFGDASVFMQTWNSEVNHLVPETSTNSKKFFFFSCKTPNHWLPWLEKTGVVNHTKHPCKNTVFLRASSAVF